MGTSYLIIVIIGLFSFAFGAGKHEEWTNRKTIFVGASVVFFLIVVYGVLMKPIIKYGVPGIHKVLIHLLRGV